MVRERIKELVDFATTESPYRNATKGWLTDDVYISWGAKDQKAARQTNELANVSLYWNPVSRLVSIIFAVVFLASIFVFSAVSFAHGRFQITNRSTNIGRVSQQLVSEEIEPTQSVTKASIQPQEENVKALVAPALIPTLESRQELTSSKSRSDFAAAALGGKKVTR